MPLPPLVNLFAAAFTDPTDLVNTCGRMRASGAFDWVCRHPSGWLIGGRQQGGPETKAAAPTGNLVFAQGEQQLGPHVRKKMRQVAGDDPKRLGEFDMDFTVAHLSRGKATVARSCGGQLPVYCWSDERHAGFSTLLSYAARFRLNDPTLDPLVTAAWLSWSTAQPDDRTFLSGVTGLRRGTAAVLRPATRIRTVRYWNPAPTSLPPRRGGVPREIADAFREQVLTTLRDETCEEPGNLLLLSGGVDSTVLAALVRRQLRRPLATLTILPKGSRAREREVACLNRTEREFQTFPVFRFPAGGNTRRALLRPTLPAFHQALHPALGALQRIRERMPVRVLLGGEYADELCGAQWHLPDWIRSAPMSRLFRFRELPFGRKDLGRWVKWRALNAAQRPQVPFPPSLPACVHPSVQEEYSEWHHRYRKEMFRHADPYRTLERYMDRDGAMAMYWELACAQSVRRIWPFVSKRTLELSYSLHPDDLIGPGIKRLLRRAFAGHVPAWSLYRGDKGSGDATFTSADLIWSQPLPADLEPMVRPGWFPHPPARITGPDAVRLQQLVSMSVSLTAIRSERAVDAHGARCAPHD